MPEVWTFEEAAAYLNSTAPQGTSVYGLGRINHLLDLLGRPEKSFTCITIVGTNGKGSVTAFLDSLFRAHGLKVTCHIKPHLESVTERIRIDGKDSTQEQFAESLWAVNQAVLNGWTREDKPTYFELIFAAAVFAAKVNGAQVALLEAGLGGRLDAVNGIDAQMVVMTSIGLDHTELLGDTLEAIVKEKLAVVRPGATLVCQENPPEVISNVRNYCHINNVHLVEAPGDTGLTSFESGILDFCSPGTGIIEGLSIGLKGHYQHQNVHLALLALEIFARDVQPKLFPSGLNRDAIRDGLASARLPGRWEEIHLGELAPSVILDGAHNSDGLRMVFSELEDRILGSRTVVMGSKANKKVDDAIPDLLKVADSVIFVPVPEVASHAPDELARLAMSYLDKQGGISQVKVDKADSILDGLAMGFKATADRGTILVTGSLYLVGAARSILMRPDALELLSKSKGAS
jgi:dihydrofolate synthase/folylpolyglutamate synthase